MNARGQRGPDWTAHDDDELRMYWGLHPIKSIAKRLNRTPGSVYYRAGVLELGLGCPQGFERMSTAVERTGCSKTLLKKILIWARVPMRSYASHPKCQSAQFYVEPCSVDEAVAKWCRAENMVDAGRRTGVPSWTLRRWYLEDLGAGLLSEISRATKTVYRVMPDTIDAVVARRKLGTETVAQGAKRVGVPCYVLHAWLLEAGVAHGFVGRGRAWRLNPADVDRVVAERRECWLASVDELGRRRRRGRRYPQSQLKLRITGSERAVA